jgi:hypothetical protein
MSIVLLILALNQTLLAKNQKCEVDPNIMVSIMMNEGHPKKDFGYPFIISLNNKNEAKIARKFYKNLFLDNRTLDCRKMDKCVEISKVLLKSGIINMDLGPFQINPRFHNMPLDYYFSVDKSYDKACAYVTEMIEKYGYGWYAIASYHSQTAKHNYKYQKQLIKNYVSVQN